MTNRCGAALAVALGLGLACAAPAALAVRAPPSSRDVNGDGIDDVMVLGHFRQMHGAQHGPLGAAVLFGRRSWGDVDRAHPGRHGLRISGLSGPGFDAEHLETKIVGDVNGDGLADVALAWDRFTQPDGPDRVQVALIFGGRSTRPVNVAHLGKRGVTLRGAASVEPVGDFNGDGLGDIAVTSPRRDETWVVPGSHALRSMRVRVRTTHVWRVQGPVDAISGVGDLDGDGRDDLIGTADLGCGTESCMGVGWLIHGRRRFLVERAAHLPEPDGLLCPGEAPFATDTWGLHQAMPLGDVNGDRAPDVAFPMLRDSTDVGVHAVADVVFGPLGRSPSSTCRIPPASYVSVTPGQRVLPFVPLPLSRRGDPDGGRDVLAAGDGLPYLVPARSIARGPVVPGSRYLAGVSQDRLGEPVPVGDVNGDGSTDLLFGEGLLVLGSSDPNRVVDLSRPGPDHVLIR